MQINFEQIKKKIEIENNLLSRINCDLKECIDDIEFIYKYYKYNDFTNNLDSNLISLTKIFENNIINNEDNTQTQIIKKIFDNVNNTYYAFQYFYIKKNDFMGMNLTGLINGKIETGIGFRNCIIKLVPTLLNKNYPILYLQYKNNIDNYSFYLLKSDQINWNNIINQNYKYFILISDYANKQYNFFGQN